MVYQGSLSQSQNRAGWSVQFRHPAVIDPRTGRVGRRMRYGLGTRDEASARQLVDQLNDLLSDGRWWTPLARPAAAARLDPRVVEIFYGALDADDHDGREIRERLLPLPSRDTAWKRVLLLGTTGAGKTTLVRQLIGTDPEEERFPTTATGRTTIADTEIVLREGPFEAAVSFFPMDEVREYLVDCLLRAAVLAFRGDDRAEVQRAVLQHADQRFRFNYILGDGEPSGAQAAGGPTDLLDLAMFDQPAAPTLAMAELGQLGDDGAPAAIRRTVDRVTELARVHGDRLAHEYDPEGVEEPRVLQELIEQGLDSVLKDDDEIHALVEELVDQMATRFDLVDNGELVRNRQGWADSWTFASQDRATFVRQLRRFTSNSKAGFGRLLTPLVSGVRVAAPFQPTWHAGGVPPLVLFDTEGLGHTPDSSASMPTTLTRLMDEADAVLLVDNAEQPMQAAPSAALVAIARAGQATKLHLAFTHFDGVSGDNLPSDADRARHVLLSCEGVLSRIGQQLGAFGERPLRARARHAYFLSDIQKRYRSEDAESLVVRQLTRLLGDLTTSGSRPSLAETRPVYDKANLVVAIRDAAEDFTSHWAAVLGLRTSVDVTKEHWARVKALSRRLAFRSGDEYLNLRPVADLQAELQSELVNLVQNPLRWTAGEPSDEDKQALLEDLVGRLNRKLLDLCRRRVAEERHPEWQAAYLKAGPGSTFERARLISSEIYGQAAPVPRATPTAASNTFLREVMAIVAEAAEELDVHLV